MGYTYENIKNDFDFLPDDMTIKTVAPFYLD